MSDDYVLAGFWIRLGATLIDLVIIVCVTVPLTLTLHPDYFTSQDIIAGPGDFLINYVAPAIYTIVFWTTKCATPGKMALGLKLVSKTDGQPLGVGAALLRYFGYFVSALPLGLGYFWILWDKQRQAWHDKFAGSIVVKRPTKEISANL